MAPRGSPLPAYRGGSPPSLFRTGSLPAGAPSSSPGFVGQRKRTRVPRQRSAFEDVGDHDGGYDRSAKRLQLLVEASLQHSMAAPEADEAATAAAVAAPLDVAQPVGAHSHARAFAAATAAAPGGLQTAAAVSMVAKAAADSHSPPADDAVAESPGCNLSSSNMSAGEDCSTEVRIENSVKPPTGQVSVPCQSNVHSL